jgi:hypothetical protein
LIAAFKGEQDIRECAQAILSEPNIEYWYSPLLRLEVILQPSHYGYALELEFYKEYFSHANCYGDLDRIFTIAEPEAIKHGIPVIDALHVAAANLARCKVLVTTEKSTKPMFRTKLTKVVSILGIKRHADVRKLIGSS